MRGSVYERRDEIYVYNAVGIAPRYVFFMFLAEAVVYAVVGAMLGYLLSQGVGRILTEIGLTGGMNLTFTSIATIYASLAIGVVVILSTWFPARDAMRIAAPAEDSGWDIPEPDGNAMEFDLPFTFSAWERIAVLEFVYRFLRENGEGSAGRFLAGMPTFTVIETRASGEKADSGPPDTGGPDYLPAIETMIWLKPFELGVSQRLSVTFPFDPDTGKYKAVARLDHRSGTQESWTRLNRGFIQLVRRHFLHWRIVPDADREEMLKLARDRMLRSLGLKPDLSPAAP